MGRSRLIVSSVIAVLLGIGLPAAPAGAAGPNVVTEWALIVQTAIHSPGEPRAVPSSYLLHTITQLAVYDAVMAVEGGFEPFHTAVKAAEDADVRAAVATAAYRAARGRVAPSQFGYLDDRYGTYLATIPDGAPKQHGIEVGEAAAAGILALRANDGFSNTVTYQCSGAPLPLGEFEPDGGCAIQPLEAKLAQVTPFTFPNPGQFRPDGPSPSASDQWAADFDEVKAYGGATSTVRTAEQTDVAYFWSEHAYVHWNRNITNLVTAKGLGVADTARLLAMLWTAMSDSLIAGFDAKYFYRAWRPRTAVLRAAEDGNPKTIPDPTWTPLISVNHPEYPSAHGFVTGAIRWCWPTSSGPTRSTGPSRRARPPSPSSSRRSGPIRTWAPLRPRSTTPASGAGCTSGTARRRATRSAPASPYRRSRTASALRPRLRFPPRAAPSPHRRRPAHRAPRRARSRPHRCWRSHPRAWTASVTYRTHPHPPASVARGCRSRVGGSDRNPPDRLRLRKRRTE